MGYAPTHKERMGIKRCVYLVRKYTFNSPAWYSASVQKAFQQRIKRSRLTAHLHAAPLALLNC